MYKKLTVATLIISTLTSCVSHPKILSFTPASIVVDYAGSSMYEATRVAQQYCDSIGKDAQYVRTEESFFSGKKEGFFNCIESKMKSPGGGAPGAGAYGGPIFNNITPPVINNNNSK